MKFVGALCFAIGCAAVSASTTVPRTLGSGSRMVSESRQERPVNHWVGDPVAKEAFPKTAVVQQTRGGGDLDIKLAHKTLWAALCLNVLGALSAVFKPEMISSHLMTAAGEATEWCCHFLAIMWLGSACHTLLSIQDGSANCLKIAHKANIVTMGLSCLLGVWQYSQGVFDDKHTLGFIAVTGIITGALLKKECD